LAISPHLKKIVFDEDDKIEANTEFPLLKLSEKDAAAFISSSLKSIECYFKDDSPVADLACQIANLNKVTINFMKY